MFNEDEDWNDDEDARVLSKCVLKNTSNTASSSNVKSKVVGKKSLLQTLQTLGSVPEWKSDKNVQDSDSETEVASPQDEKKKKKKKKRRKRQRQAEGTGEQQENGDLHETVEEEKPTVKKRKKDKQPKDSKITNISENDAKDKEMNIPEDQPDSDNKLNRQQWKNKMKNKRKCKNKFRQNQPEEAESVEKAKPKEEGKADSCRDNNSEKNFQTTAKKKEKKPKPQKRKKTKDDTDTSSPAGTLTEEQQVIKKKKTKDDAGSKQKTAEPEASITDSQHQLPIKKPKPDLSKWEKQRREKLQKILQSKAPEQQESLVEVQEEPAQAAPENEVKEDRSASLRSRMEQRLESARFRYINEVLYSTSSGEAKRMFKQDPQAFGIYHRGYTAQVQKWPVNPVDRIIAFIQQKSPSLVVADFGCGDCKIARSVKNKVHSFDLAATCELVTVCDMAHVPLPDASVDIAVFCLSLMGTNLADFLSEANRVLKMGGIVKIAEVASRFENVRSFTSALSNLGFKMVSTDTENSHFFSFELRKTGNAPDKTKKVALQLRPCVYKKR